MKKGKIFVFVLLFGILILSSNALALPVGQHVGFFDLELPGKPVDWTWTHSLGNFNFIPHLDGDEPIIIEHALLLLSLNFTFNSKGCFLASVELDGNMLGNINYHSWGGHSVYNWHWWKSITDPAILNEIGIDKLAEINIDVKKGTLNYVHNSFITGNGKVAPEPISIALIGAGLAGLPIAVRFRRLLRK